MEGTHTAVEMTAEERCRWMTAEIGCILERNQNVEYLRKMLALAQIYERMMPDE